MQGHLISRFVSSSAQIIAVVLACQGQNSQAGDGKHDFRAAATVPAYAKEDTAKVMSIAVADLDQQNGPDIVTVQTDGMFNALYNNGGGKLRNTYHNDSAVTLNPNIVYIEAADLNGDSYPDVVAMDTKNSAFLIFLNQGDGTFAAAVNLPAGSAGGAKLGGLTVADVNADGKPDVITLSSTAGAGSTTFSQQTFLGTGDGTFRSTAPVETVLSGSFSLTAGRSLGIADMNRDGKPDLIAQIIQSVPAQTLGIRVSLGDGNGSFQSLASAGPTVPAPPQPASNLTLADVNGDGIPDAVFLTFNDHVYVALGQSDGTLADPSTVLSNMSGAVLLALADLNRDGMPDLVLFGSGEFGIFAGKGDGTFQAGAQYTAGYGIYQQPAPADFDGDGNLDIASLDYTNGRIGLYPGHGDGTFAAATPVHPANRGNTEWAGNIQVITAGDLNGDGNPDVLAYDWPHSSAAGRADLYTGLNDGTGKFSFTLSMPPGRLQELAGRYGSFIIEASTADFNGDGRPDVIFRTQAGLAVVLANADGTLNPDPIDLSFPVPVGCGPFNYLTAGDVNGDGFQDIVAAYAQNKNCPASASTPSGLFVLLGDGTGHFQAGFTPFGNSLYFVRVADLNADGKLDVVVADNVRGGGFQLFTLPGIGDGTFDIAAARTVIGHEFISNILLVDYNGDGRLDLALSTDGVAAPDGSPLPGSQGILLLPGFGDFTFDDPTIVLPGIRSIWNGTAYADFNADGTPDLVVATYAKEEPYMETFGMIVLPNRGDGTFGPPRNELMPLDVAGRNAVTFVADFNRDGAPDVVLGGGLSSPLFLNAAGDVR